jgi:hypothetical protein
VIAYPMIHNENSIITTELKVVPKSLKQLNFINKQDSTFVHCASPKFREYLLSISYQNIMLIIHFHFLSFSVLLLVNERNIILTSHQSPTNPNGFSPLGVLVSPLQFIIPTTGLVAYGQAAAPPKTCCVLSPQGECILDLNPTIPSFSVTYTNMAPASHATIILAAGTCPNLSITIPPSEVVTQTYNCGNVSKILVKNETSTASVKVSVNQ